MARRKSPKVIAAVLLATSAAALSYKLYDALVRPNDDESSIEKKKRELKSARYANKSIAVTLSHSVLSSGLPLNDILLSSKNVTFILPPYLSVDDLESQIKGDSIDNTQESQVYEVPRTLLRNYKLLQCSNIDGYFQILKNLRPDTLFECSDDLGVRGSAPPDLRRFVKEVVALDSDSNSVYSVLSEVFL